MPDKNKEKISLLINNLKDLNDISKYMNNDFTLRNKIIENSLQESGNCKKIVDSKRVKKN